MSAPSTVSTTWQWPTDVLNFAAHHQVDSYLDPLLAALHNVYPTATRVRVLLEDDPEIRDDWHITFEVSVPAADVPDYVAATRPWHRELSRICPAPLACIFRHLLLPVDS
jgi:hypothetical protein